MKIGIQMYSVKEHMKEDPQNAIRKVTSIGYRYLETANYQADTDPGVGFPVSAEEIKRTLADTGSEIVGAHLQPLAGDYLKVNLEYFAELGTRFFIVPMEFYRDKSDVLRLAERLNQAAEQCGKYGIELLYHNHYHEFQLMDGELVYEMIMNHTDPELVKIELDTYWAMRAGQNPISLMKKYGKRIRMIHQKDFPAQCRDELQIITHQNRTGVVIDMPYFNDHFNPEAFTEIGNGIMDIQNIINVGNEICGSEYIIVEQDASALDELLSVEISLNNLKRYKGIEQ